MSNWGYVAAFKPGDRVLHTNEGWTGTVDRVDDWVRCLRDDKLVGFDGKTWAADAALLVKLEQTTEALEELDKVPGLYYSQTHKIIDQKPGETDKQYLRRILGGR